MGLPVKAQELDPGDDREHRRLGAIGTVKTSEGFLTKVPGPVTQGPILCSRDY